MSTDDDARPASSAHRPLRPLRGGQGQRDRADPGALAVGLAVGLGHHPDDARLRGRRRRTTTSSTAAEFERLVAGGQLLEWASSPATSTARPAARCEARLAAGQPVLLKIDLQGARQVRAAMPDAQLVFLPRPAGGAQRRLVGRGTDDAETIRAPPGARRRGNGRRAGVRPTVVNDFVERAADELLGLLGSTTLSSCVQTAAAIRRRG